MTSRKTRPFQFGLRTLFWAMAAVAGLVALPLDSFNPSQDAVLFVSLVTAYVLTITAVLYLDPSR
jgi:hypothetical protein